MSGAPGDEGSGEGDRPPYAVALARADGRTERIEVGDGRTVTEAAEVAGVELPSACRFGACATCAGRVLEGAVRHRRPPRALTERHREAGYALLCVATPTTDCRIRVGVDLPPSNRPE